MAAERKGEAETREPPPPLEEDRLRRRLRGASGFAEGRPGIDWVADGGTGGIVGLAWDSMDCGVESGFRKCCRAIYL
jgi:hypothetical protein